MKKIINLLSVIVVSITIFACSKSGGSSTTITKPPQPKLQCYENGVLYNYDAIWDSTFGWKQFGGFEKDSSASLTYVTNALSTNVTNHNQSNYLYLGLPNKLTSIGSYYGNSKTNAMLDAVFNGVYASSGNNTDTIIVTSLTNGIASGTFVATIKLGNNTVLHITNGTFSNLPVY